MANIKMCDFCGKVSNRMAAEVLIRPTDQHADGYALNSSTGELQRAIKDCCHDCLEQFTQVREIKVLEADGNI